jgi:DNA-binding HxlR family transcriptional regulator
MPLPSDYARQGCSLARTLEIVGERWTLLIVRDAFYGARHFGEFVDHLQIPRAVLADRLTTLVEADVMRKVGTGRRVHYELTDKGVSLWPTAHALMAWGDEHYAPKGPRRIFIHAADDGVIGPTGACGSCGLIVPAAEIVVTPGPGLELPRPDDDVVTTALREPHRLLQPLRAQPAVA